MQSEDHGLELQIEHFSASRKGQWFRQSEQRFCLQNDIFNFFGHANHDLATIRFVDLKF